MAFRRKTQRFKNAIEISEYHTARYGAPGQKRQPKKKPTREQIEKRNQWQREKTARHKIRQWMDINDYLTTLTYRREARPPDMATAQKQFGRLMRLVRTQYRKRGYELRYLKNIEVGTKNGWHIHVIINRIPDTDIILKSLWTFGKVQFELLHEKGEFRDLAAYITKTPKTDPRLRETNYSTSKNLPVPPPEEKIYRHWKTWNEIKIPDGYYLDQDAFHEGINPITGYPYRIYTLLKIRRE